MSGGTPQPLAHPDGRITPPTLDDLSDRAMLEEHLALAALPLTSAYKEGTEVVPRSSQTYRLRNTRKRERKTR